jgi:hypothetical protein
MEKIIQELVYQDLCLKAANEAAMKTALSNAGLIDAEDNPVNCFIDVIGKIWKPTGATKTDEDGMIVPVMSMIDGWHVNLRGNFTEAQKALLPIIEVSTPMRVWA